MSFYEEPECASSSSLTNFFTQNLAPPTPQRPLTTTVSSSHFSKLRHTGRIEYLLRAHKFRNMRGDWSLSRPLSWGSILMEVKWSLEARRTRIPIRYTRPIYGWGNLWMSNTQGQGSMTRIDTYQTHWLWHRVTCATSRGFLALNLSDGCNAWVERAQRRDCSQNHGSGLLFGIKNCTQKRGSTLLKT